MRLTTMLCAGIAVAAAAGCAEQAPAPSPEDLIATAELESALLSPPPGCTELDAGDFLNGVELTPVMYGQSPTYRSAITAMNDPAVTDSLRIRLDAATSPGVYSLGGANSNTFTCEQCVFAFADNLASGMFVANSGLLAVALKVSPEQTLGALVNVTLRQAVAAPPLSAPYTGSAIVPGGACYWIRFSTWNTIRKFGCNPEHGSFTSQVPGHTCFADSRAGNDGHLQRNLGKKKQGEACTRTAATDTEPQSSDCARGYACTSIVTGELACRKTCDFMAPDPGCGGNGLVCGILGVCIEQAVMEPVGFVFEDVPIGASCVNDFAEFCGSEGARGVCVALQGSGSGKCYPYRRARSDCAPGEELGFVSYPLANNGFDRTYGWCFPRADFPGG